MAAPCALLFDLDGTLLASNGVEHDAFHEGAGGPSLAHTDLLELAKTGRHRAVSLPDLLLAAVAERVRLVILHYDADFDIVASITGQQVEWVAPKGSL